MHCSVVALIKYVPLIYYVVLYFSIYEGFGEPPIKLEGFGSNKKVKNQCSKPTSGSESVEVN